MPGLHKAGHIFMLLIQTLHLTQGGLVFCHLAGYLMRTLSIACDMKMGWQEASSHQEDHNTAGCESLCLCIVLMDRSDI